MERSEGDLAAVDRSTPIQVQPVGVENGEGGHRAVSQTIVPTLEPFEEIHPVVSFRGFSIFIPRRGGAVRWTPKIPGDAAGV
jgi:hypothetical protein